MCKKVGIIGLGNAGYELDNDLLKKEIWTHYKAYNKHEDTEIEAICDIDEKKLSKFNIAGFKDYRDMLKYTPCDIVSICTPTQTHYQIIKDIVKYPIEAIFCEKPLAYTSQECKEIISYCKDRGIVLAINYQRRWDNLYKTIKEMIDEKVLLDIKSIICYTNSALYMNSSHMVDLIYMLCGEIKTVYGKFDNSYVRIVHDKADPGGIFHFTTENNVEGLLYAYCDDKSKHNFEIDMMFQNGRISVSRDGLISCYGTYENSPQRKDMKEINYKMLEDYNLNIYNNRMVDAITNIIDVIEGKKYKVECSGEEAIKSIQFIEACYLADKTKEIVYV